MQHGLGKNINIEIGFHPPKELPNVTYHIVPGGLNDIPKLCKMRVGVAFKIFHKQDIQNYLNLIKEQVLPQHRIITNKSTLEVIEINVYHQPKSRYSWLTAVME